VRKSLVATARRGTEGETRYRLLETVREYAGQKLREHGEAEALRDRHLGYFLGLAEETMDLGGRHVDAWVRRVDPEYDNLRAAFAWARLRHDNGEAALRLAGALRPYWGYRGYVDEGTGWLDAALARGGTAPTSTRARALLAKAGQCVHRGDLAGAIGIGEATLAQFRETDDRAGTAWCLELLANNQNAAHAQAYAEEALPLFRELGSLDGVSRALRALGTAACLSGDYTRAAQYLEQAIAAAQEVDDWRDVPVCLGRLFDVDPRRALELCARELARLREGGDEAQVTWTMHWYGMLLLADGEYGRARQVLEESIQWGQHAGVAPYVWQALPVASLALGFTELSLGRADRAITLLGQSRKLCLEAGAVNFGDVAQFLIAAATIAQGDLAVGTSDTRECLRRFLKYGYRRGVVCSFVQLAHLAHLQGDMRRCSVLLGTASTFRREVEAMGWKDRFTWRWYRDAQSTIVEPALAAARAQLGDAEFGAAHVEGQQMTMDQAVEYALAG
jgi:tetratricopeptide (TPR) repeat protein